jgi:hypothetical protein
MRGIATMKEKNIKNWNFRRFTSIFQEFLQDYCVDAY